MENQINFLIIVKGIKPMQIDKYAIITPYCECYMKYRLRCFSQIVDSKVYTIKHITYFIDRWYIERKLTKQPKKTLYR